MNSLLRRVEAEDVRSLRRSAVDATTRNQALEIVERVRRGGDTALRDVSERLGDLAPGASWRFDREQLERAAAELGDDESALLERTAERVRNFALAQRAALQPVDVRIPGGRAGHSLMPVASAGCYAPGGRFPLPSSVLMTAVTARAAEVERVVVASPKPAPITLAAAWVAGADELLAIGGAQAIAALSYGTESIDAVDFLCGPGNRWVTAAKQLVYGDVGVDSLAGPSELVVLADGAADAELVAADLLAQAEHDVDALPILVTTEGGLLERVQAQVQRQLPALGESCAPAALENGYAVLAHDLDEAVRLCELLAPEHLAVFVQDAAELEPRLRHCGALFLGAQSAEVLGDYGAGPNHVLPTGGGARFRGGLSVFDFLRTRTWLALEPGAEQRSLAADAAALAELEGLNAHAFSARARTR